MSTYTLEVFVPLVESQDELKYEETPGAPNYDSLMEASTGRAASVRSATKHKTRRKRTVGKKVAHRLESQEVSSPRPDSTPQLDTFEVFSTLIKIMNGRHEGRDYLLKCLLELERMVETNDNNAEALANADASIDVIISLIKGAGNDDNVKATGCWVLSNLARAEGCADFLCKRGMTDLVLQFIKETNSEQVQHASLALLCNIALHENERLMLTKMGAIPAVVTALVSYLNHEWIQYTSLQILQNIANTDDLCGKLMEYDAVPYILHAMRHFDDHDELLQSSNWIFSCLAFSGDDDCREILQIQYHIALAIALGMENSPDHCGIQFTGCSALSNLARNEDLLESLVSDGMVNVVTAALRRHDSHEGIQMAGCRCYVVLAPNKGARQLVKLLQGLSLCEHVLDMLPRSSAAIEARDALRLFCSTDGDGLCVIR